MCNGNCSCCERILYAGTVTIGTTNITINLPSQAICNNEKVCFVITTNVASPTKPVPVFISIGTSSYKMINQNGNYVYSDQLRARKLYSVSMKTDTMLAKNCKCNLCKTVADIPCIPATA